MKYMHKIRLGKYKDLKITPYPMYTQSDLDLAVIESVVKLANQWAKNNTPVKLGDEVIVTLQAKCDGMFVPELSKSNFKYSVGDPAMLEQFTEVVSKKAGESFSMEIPFPENAPIERIQGKTVTFYVTIQELLPATQIEVTDEIARQIDPQISGLEEFKSRLRTIITNNWNQMMRENNIQSILNGIIIHSEFELEEKEVKEVYENIVKETREAMFSSTNSQMLASVFSTDDDEYFYDDCKILAEKNIKEDLVITEIINLEAISISSEELEEGETVLSQYFSSEDSLKEYLLREKVFDLLLQWNLEQPVH